MKKLTRLLCALTLITAMACSASESDTDPDPNPNPPGPDASNVDQPDAAPQPDAGQVNAKCDYTEMNDSGNDVIGGGASEATALEFSEAGGEIVLCGKIDPANKVDGVIADADFFDFSVAGAQDSQIPFRITLTSPQGDSLSDLGLQLSFLPGGGADPVTVTSAFYESGYALATNSFFIPGNFQFLVLAGDDPLPTAPIDYEIHIDVAPKCDADANPATFTEVEGSDPLQQQQAAPDNRVNDVVSVAFANEPPSVLTGRGDDAPEATGVTLSPGTTVHLAGSSALETADGDEYLDRDTYQVATDATVNEIDIRLTWPDGDVDMDLLTFLENAADTELSGFAGAIIGTDDDEFFTVRVPSSSNLWIWAATYDDTGLGGDTGLPAGYDITICPRSFTP